MNTKILLMYLIPLTMGFVGAYIGSLLFYAKFRKIGAVLERNERLLRGAKAGAKIRQINGARRAKGRRV